ncbi:unnamed protein product, partial [Rotaria magnacalcarata]
FIFIVGVIDKNHIQSGYCIKYYLAVVQPSPNIDFATSINLSRECIPIGELFNSTLISCQTHYDLNCFIDEASLCVYTNDRHVNCVEFNHKNKNLQYSSSNYCSNGAQCLQDHPGCPFAIICVRTDCFFDNQCQFYATGLSSALDEILRYEIKHNMNSSKQPFSVKLNILITMIILITGIINRIFSVLTFKKIKFRKGLVVEYIFFASSITSL